MGLKHVTIDGIRLHLSPDENKLLINGFYSVYLNNTAKHIIEVFIENCWEHTADRENIIPKTLDNIYKIYPDIPKDQLHNDLNRIVEAIRYFGNGQVPTHLVGIDKFETNAKVPQRMDLALTYECDNACPHCYLSKNENKTIMSTDEWKKVIDTLWGLGIPQVAFTGGECTMRKDLPELVKYAENMVTGIITNGTLLTPELANTLKDNDLDWIQITLESTKPEVHDAMQGRKGAYAQTIRGIENAVNAGLAVSINSTLTQKNVGDVFDLINFAKEKKIKFVSTNALINSGRGISNKQVDGIEEQGLVETLRKANEMAKAEDITFNWFLPTCYKNFDPVKEGFGQRCCSACSINMLIEPDGTVIPCQSWTDLKLGNILLDKWETIWDSKISKKIRNHGFAPDACKGCDKLDLCGGGCPLSHINGRKVA